MTAADGRAAPDPAAGLRVRQRLRRAVPLVAIVAAAVLVLGVHLAVGWLYQEPPNYSRIEEDLYLGGLVPRPPPGATAVLNLCEADDPYRAAAYLWQPIPDTEPAPSLDWLREQVRFVDDQREAGRVVFVHCRNGVSRSSLVVVAHLMARHGWSRDEALAFVRSRREAVRPNPAFLRLLQDWEKFLRREPVPD